MSPFFRLSFLFMSDSFFTEYELGERLDQSNQDNLSREERRVLLNDPPSSRIGHISSSSRSCRSSSSCSSVCRGESHFVELLVESPLDGHLQHAPQRAAHLLPRQLAAHGDGSTHPPGQAASQARGLLRVGPELEQVGHGGHLGALGTAGNEGGGREGKV